jgi:hypothetical protein
MLPMLPLPARWPFPTGMPRRTNISLKNLFVREETAGHRTLKIAGWSIVLNLTDGTLASSISEKVFRPGVPHRIVAAIEAGKSFPTRSRRVLWKAIERRAQREIWGWLLDLETARYTARVFGYEATCDDYSAIYANLDFVRDFARSHRGVQALLRFALLPPARWQVFAKAAGVSFTNLAGVVLRSGIDLATPAERIAWIRDAYPPETWDYLCQCAPPVINWIVRPFSRPIGSCCPGEGADTLYALRELFSPLAKTQLPCPLAVLPVIHRFNPVLTSESLLCAALAEADRQRHRGTLQHFADIELPSVLEAFEVSYRPGARVPGAWPTLPAGASWEQARHQALAVRYPVLTTPEIEWLDNSTFAADAHDAGLDKANLHQVRALIAAGVTPQYLPADLAVKWILSAGGTSRAGVAGKYCRSGWPAHLLELAFRYPDQCLCVEPTRAVYPLEQIDVPASTQRGDLVTARGAWHADTTAHCSPDGDGKFKVIFTSPTSQLPHLLYVEPGLYPFRVEEKTEGEWGHFASYFTRAEAAAELAAIEADGGIGRVLDKLAGLPAD